MTDKKQIILKSEENSENKMKVFYSRKQEAKSNTEENW